MLWNDAYALGVDRIDAQHRGLFTMVNRILDILSEQDSERTRRACVEAVKYLAHYALTHFSDEEAYQKSVGYPDYPRHKQAHDQFTRRVLEMEQEMSSCGFSPESVQKFVGMLTSWLSHHIMSMDRAIVNKAETIDPALRRNPSLLLQRVMILEGQALFGGQLKVLDDCCQADYTGSERFLAADCRTEDGRCVRVLAALPPALSLLLAQKLLGDFVRGMDHLAAATLQSLFSLTVLRFVEILFPESPCTIAQLQDLNFRELPFLTMGGESLCSIRFGSELLGDFEMRAWRLA